MLVTFDQREAEPCRESDWRCVWLTNYGSDQEIYGSHRGARRFIMLPAEEQDTEIVVLPCYAATGLARQSR